MVDIQSQTAEIRRGKQRKKEKRNHRAKILWPAIFHRAAIKRKMLNVDVHKKFQKSKKSPPPSFPHFLQAGCPSCHPTNSVKALKATSAFGLGRRC